MPLVEPDMDPISYLLNIPIDMLTSKPTSERKKNILQKDDHVTSVGRGCVKHETFGWNYVRK